MKGEQCKHGNPYANIADDDDRNGFVESEPSVATVQRESSGRVLLPENGANDRDPLTSRPSAPSDQHSDYAFHSKRPEGSGNPYANIVEDDECQPYAAATLPADSAEGLTKTDFNTICRAILVRYIPAAEHGRLRLHHREFIARNEGRSPRVRRLLVNALRRYDLSDTPGLASKFNRGEFEFTEAKLKLIEQTVLREAGE